MTRNSESLEFVSDPKVTLHDKVLKFLIHFCLKQGELPIKSHISLPHGMDVSETLMLMLGLSRYLLICKKWGAQSTRWDSSKHAQVLLFLSAVIKLIS